MGSGVIVDIFSVAILAGGRGRRLGGRSKASLDVGGRSILARQLSVAREITPHILVVTADDSDIQGADVPIVRDHFSGAGALGGLYTALKESPADQTVVVAADMPFLTSAFLLSLATLGTLAQAVVPRNARGLHPLCASYRRDAADHLAACIKAGALGVTDAIRGLDVREMTIDELAPYDPDGLLLLNVNTPEDYERAREAAGDGDQACEKGTAGP